MVQERLEATLFAIMEGRGFGADYMERYKMVSNFFQQRRPLIVLICGIPCSGNPRPVPPSSPFLVHFLLAALQALSVCGMALDGDVASWAMYCLWSSADISWIFLKTIYG